MCLQSTMEYVCCCRKPWLVCSHLMELTEPSNSCWTTVRIWTIQLFEHPPFPGNYCIPSIQTSMFEIIIPTSEHLHLAELERGLLNIYSLQQSLRSYSKGYRSSLLTQLHVSQHSSALFDRVVNMVDVFHHKHWIMQHNWPPHVLDKTAKLCTVKFM